MTPHVPADIQALQKRWAARGSLSPEEIQKLADWASQSISQQAQAFKAERDAANVQPGDIVAFTMPPTVQGNAYSINGRAYYGACEAPFAVYCELARMYEQDRIGDLELRNQRGSKEFGLKQDLEGFAIQPIGFRVVQRAEGSRAA